MPRSFLHATIPGPGPTTGILGGLIRWVFLAFFLVIALFVLLFTLAMGLVFVLFSALGIGPKRKMPQPRFGFPFPPQSGDSAKGSTSEQAKNKTTTPKELESFHGSLEEFMEQRHNQNPQ